MTANDYRWCNFCQQEKPQSEFYERQTRCKSCMYLANKARSKNKKPKGKLTTVFGSEALVIRELRSRGIPAYPGKSVSYALVDVVAWGCVGLEVKSSKNYDNYWQWGFTKAQNNKLQADIIVLTMNDPEPQFYLFDANHPVFFIDGKRKTAVTYQPEPCARKHHDRYVMTDADMAQALNRWELIETARQAFCIQLMTGIDIPKWVR